MSFQIRSTGHVYSTAEVLLLLEHWPTPFVQADAVALQGPNSPAYVLRLLHLWSQHRLVLPLDPKIPSAEVHQLLRQEGVSNPETTDTLEADLQQALRGVAQASAQSATLSALRHTPEQLMPLSQPASLIRTSGSSAYPKLAQHSWGNHVYSAQGSLKNLPLGPQDRWLLSLPLFHVGGLAIVVRCWLAGATLAIPDTQQSLSDALTHFKPTHLSLVPTQLQRLLQHPQSRVALQGCTAILLGGAPVSAELIAQAQQAELNIHTSYGATEMSSQITTTPPGYWLNHPATPVVSGELLPHRELRLHQGEVLVRGQTLFQGYRQNGVLQQQQRKDGWFATGDLGHWHHGQLRINGRKDYQFISGGENIQPEEIERYLLAFSEVQEAMVVPVRDHEFGARPVAFLRLAHGVDAVSFFKALPDALSQSLPKFKIPQGFYPWPDTLQTEGLKPRRHTFQRYAQGLYPDG